MGWGEQIEDGGGGGAGKGESEMLKWNSNCGRCLMVAVFHLWLCFFRMMHSPILVDLVLGPSCSVTCYCCCWQASEEERKQQTLAAIEVAAENKQLRAEIKALHRAVR